jgi:pimeloyl-ACP methyl ester carboxylesterase
VPSITANGLTFEYDERGNPGDPVILLVMGLGVQMIFWPEALCDMIAARGFRVVRFDNRDVGLSTKLDHLGVPRVALEAVKFALHLPLNAPYYIDDMARDAAGVLDALGIARAHLVGVSMGGMISQNLAARAPEKVASLVSIMSTTGARRLPGPTMRARRALLLKPAKAGDIEGATVRLMKLLRVIGSRTHPAEEGYLRALCERHVRRSYHPPGMARQLVAIAASGDRTAAVRAIKAPTLVLHGDEDPLLPPSHGEATARAIQQGGGRATFSMIAGMGHDLPVVLLPELADRIATHCASSA